MSGRDIAAVLKVYSPDVVGFRRSPTSGIKSCRYIEGETPSCGSGRPTGYQLFLDTVQKDKYNIVDSDVMYFSTNGKNNIRLVTWGVFEDITTKERFIVFNTHWSWESAEIARAQAAEEAALIRQVIAKYNYPVFCTADYNTIQHTDNYNYFRAYGMVDAKYVAQERRLKNISGGCGALELRAGDQTR